MSVLLNRSTLIPVAVLAMMLATAARAEQAEIYQQNFLVRFSLRAHGTVVGSTEWSLTTNNANELVYESKSKTTGIAALISNDHIVESSIWRRQPHGLLPHRYHYDRSGGKKRRTASVAFDWPNGLALSTAKGRTWSLPVSEGTLDKLSYVLAMMHDLGVGKRDLHYQVADGAKISLYHFKSHGQENLDTPLGVLSTLVLKRVRDDKRETTYWCAPDFRYLPVKVEHREKDGSVITLSIKSVQGISVN